ncbi:MAG: epoxyqueuosine reductase QueH [Synergistaceae bacterium]|jgi:predicted adenine nucleotide alpha hydrolase (AANH) superfamily ATPase|nr:epoxyqueuosine reductase QueH [Synergistaceae bacterium]
MKTRLLLHICCAPDATVPWPALAEEGFNVSGFFYGGNIHPPDEWNRRRDAVKRLTAVMRSETMIVPYEPDSWLDMTRESASDPEGGERCSVCVGIQLEAAARYACENGYDCLCTTLSISPHKNPGEINTIGAGKASVAGVKWISRVWRKKDGFKLSVARSLKMGLYRQNYCGCVYSMRRAAGTGDADERQN